MGEKPVPPSVGDSVSVPPVSRNEIAPPNALTGVGGGFRRLHQWYMRDRLRAQQSRTTVIQMDDEATDKTTNRPLT